MFAVIAAVLFALAGIISGSGTHVSSAWFAPMTLVCFGLFFVALAGAVSAWPWPGVRR